MATINLIDLVPDINISDDSSGDLQKFLVDLLQPSLDAQVAEQQRWLDQGDPDLANESTLAVMLESLGNPFEEIFTRDVDSRRLLVRVLVEVYRKLGIKDSIAAVVRTLTGIEITDVVSPAVYQKGFKLVIDILGDTAGVPVVADPSNTDFGYLSPGPSFLRYSFTVTVPSALTQDQRELLTTIIKKIKPAHTHFLGFTEPSVPPVINHMALGFSKLGVNAKLHA